MFTSFEDEEREGEEREGMAKQRLNSFLNFVFVKINEYFACDFCLRK